MLEVKGNLWKYPADVHVITTNGTVKKDGTAVMGRGVAKQAANKYPNLPTLLGSCLNRWGNDVYYFSVLDIVTLPVKHHWQEAADPILIMRSLVKLWDVANRCKWKVIAMPRPGCGNGQLDWTDIKPLCAVLDDRFVIVNNQ